MGKPFRSARKIALAVVSTLVFTAGAARAQDHVAPRFAVSFAKTRSSQPLDGRVLLVLSTDGSDEPRMQINDSPRSQMVFGLDVDSLNPDQPAILSDNAFGYPVRYLRDVPPAIR